MEGKGKNADKNYKESIEKFMNDNKEEDKKYYTPEIEELFTGFELERIWVSDNPIEKLFGKEVWYVDSMDTFDVSEGLEDIDNKSIRVKHLDREDIESLDFEVIGGQMMTGGRIDLMRDYKDPKEEANKCLVTYSPNQQWLSISVGDDELPWSNWKTLFCGTIKNKSEFKRVLKQIGI